MDTRLEALKKKIQNSWFPANLELFGRNDAPDISTLLDLLISDALEIFKTDCPVLKARLYNSFLSDPTYLESRSLYVTDIDPEILRVLGIYNTDTVPPDMTGRLDRISGRNVTNVGISGGSPYISEQVAIDLYRRLDVDQWSGRMDRPIVMSDATGEYFNPYAENFIVFFLAQRPISADSVPSNVYKSVESFLTFNLAETVINSMGRYPLTMQMERLLNHRDEVDPARLTSVTISGKLKMSMDPPDATAESQISDLFDSGSAAKYLESLAAIAEEAKKTYTTLKYIDLGGISLG